MKNNKNGALYIQIRVKPEEKESIFGQARATGMSVSKYCRTLVLQPDAEKIAKAINVYDSIEKNMR